MTIPAGSSKAENVGGDTPQSFAPGSSPRRGDGWVTMAILGKPRGIRGEMFVLPQTNHWDRFRVGRAFRVWFPDKDRRAPVDVVLEDAWSHNGKLILKLAGVDSIDEAEQLRGGDLCIPLSDREPLPEGEFYYDDLKGLVVLDLDGGSPLGVVIGFTEGIGPGVIEVESRGAQCIAPPGPEFWQIPFAREICVDVDLEQRQLRVRLPEGLRDLNRP